MINVILCDNEPAITESVKSIITRMMFKNNVGYKIHIFNSYNTSFNTIMNSGLENKIYILDIEVGSKSGIEIAKKIREKDWISVILVLSSHQELESMAYKSKILLFDFISKFDLYDKKLENTLLMCVEKRINEDALVIKADRKLQKVNYNDILYVTYDSYSRKSIIVTENGEYHVSEPLKNICSRLKGDFEHTHKSCVVNLKKVKDIDFANKEVMFLNGTKTDLLSRRYASEVKVNGVK